MLKDYFYSLLGRYLAVHIRPGNRVLHIDPRSAHLPLSLQAKETRLVYLMEDEAMRFLNMIGNKFFAMSFSFVLNQRLRDTLCGTKVFTRETYDRIIRHSEYFGDFDPFGDFDLIFGADRMGLKIVEVPVRYRARTYGSTNISRFRHGLILLRMLQFAARKLKFI